MSRYFLRQSGDGLSMRTTSLRIGVAERARADRRTLRRFLGRRFIAGTLLCCGVVFAVVFLGQRLTASFITAPRYALGYSPQSVAVGDFNGDGIPDIALDGSILLGKGDGTFQPHQSYNGDGAIAHGAFNSDCNMDIVT